MNDRNTVMSVGQWFVTLIVLAIPILNVIMYLIWAFGAGNKNRANFCRAGLIMILISVVLFGFIAFWGQGV
ncbi:MAG: hypothetical protein ACRCUS_08730 [Anaerovoracaceae bacterium]